MTAGRIVTEYQDQPNTIYIAGRPAVAVLPDGRRIRLGNVVTGSYWSHDDVRGPVIGRNPDHVVISASDSMGPTSLELGPENILTIEEARS